MSKKEKAFIRRIEKIFIKDIEDIKFDANKVVGIIGYVGSGMTELGMRISILNMNAKNS